MRNPFARRKDAPQQEEGTKDTRTLDDRLRAAVSPQIHANERLRSHSPTRTRHPAWQSVQSPAPPQRTRARTVSMAVSGLGEAIMALQLQRSELVEQGMSARNFLIGVVNLVRAIRACCLLYASSRTTTRLTREWSLTGRLRVRARWVA